MSPRDLKINVNAEKWRRAHDEFFYIFGRTMASWADLEHGLYQWFASITMLKEGMARGIFFGARSFATRLEILESALEYALLISSEEKEFLKEALKRARQYSGFRNAIAHGTLRPTILDPKLPEHPGVLSGEHEIFIEIVKSKDLTDDSGIKIEDMLMAEENFYQLATAVNEAAPHHRKGAPLGPYHEQVLRLPSEANSKSDPTAKERGSRPQSDGRVNKKAHRAARKAAKRGD